MRCERRRVRALVKEVMEERQQLPAVGTLERMTKQLSEETKAEARRMLLLCARDGACMLLLCARDGARAWGHAAQEQTHMDSSKVHQRRHRGRHLGARYGARHLGARYGARHLGAARMDKGVATPGTARLVAPGTAPGGFGAVVGGLLSVVPIRRATSKRWTTHKLSLRRRAALSVPWRDHNGAWRACPPPLLLLPTTARPCPCDASVELLVLPLPPPLAAP